jgi:hypothetical protein
VTTFLTAMGYSIVQSAELLDWSPRKAKNLLTRGQKALSIPTHQQLMAQQLRFATETPGKPDACPDKLTIWSCSHGDCEPDQTLEAIRHSVGCGHCTELWLLAWAIDPTLHNEAMLARSETEDMRDQGGTLEQPTPLDLFESPVGWRGSAWVVTALLVFGSAIAAFWFL